MARPGSRALFALLLSAIAPPAAAQAPYAGPWDDATLAAAEAAVSRLGAKRALDIERTVLDILGLEGGVASAGSGIVATVQEVRRAMSELGARETDLEVRVELPADVLFDHDKAEIRADAATALGHLATLIRAHPGATCRLEGHTDSSGADAYNQRLSGRRAAAVERWLVEREGLDADRLAPRGFGEARPVASNDTSEGRQRNRRVEAVIEKRGAGGG